MKNSTLYKFEFLLPILASILYFFAVKQIIPKTLYVIFASITGVYFFPVKLLFDKTFSGKQLENKLTELISILIFSLLMVFPIILLFDKANITLKISVDLLSIINVLFAIYYSVIDNRKKTFVTHLGFTVLTAAILGV